eukprot:3318366-Amphidinium_carterae.1
MRHFRVRGWQSDAGDAATQVCRKHCADVISSTFWSCEFTWPCCQVTSALIEMISDGQELGSAAVVEALSGVVIALLGKCLSVDTPGLFGCRVFMSQQYR